MSIRITRLAKGLHVKVEEHRPDDDVGDIAMRLGEAYDGASKAQADVDSFSAFSEGETRKAKELQEIVRMKNAGELVQTINPKTGKPRRIDPAREYDVAALSNEVNTKRERANEYRHKANLAKNSAAAFRREINTLQDKLKKARVAKDIAESQERSVLSGRSLRH